MANVECTHEQDLLDALAAERWPDRCDAQLRSHVEDCAICADLIEAVGPLLAAREDAYADVAVPSSGTVWWRAHVRARREATLKAGRPITVVQGLAASIGLVALVALISMAAPWPALLSLLPSDDDTLMVPAIDAMKHSWWIAAIVLGTWLVAAPLAFYLAGNEE